MLNRLIAVSKKEIKQILRDKKMLGILLGFPAFLLIIFGYAVNFDVHHVKTVIYDKDNSIASKNLIKETFNSEYFDIIGYINKDSEIKYLLDEKIAQAVLIIPNNLERDIYKKNNPIKVQVLIDGVDGNTAQAIKNYFNSGIQTFNNKINIELLNKAGIKTNQAVKYEPKYWFNPELKSSKFLIPGLIGLILVITAIISVSLSLVREKERGTIEQINVSSIRIVELLVGKSLPYFVLALFNALFVLVAGYVFFDVSVTGSYWLLLLSTVVFLMASLSIGIFISVIAETQQLAFTMATFVSMLPSVILSGFIFPIDSMPYLVQLLTNITPVKFYIIALRGIILKGVGLSAFYMQLIYLMLFFVVFMSLSAILNYRKNKIA
ncbi:MAG TPA: ABC transporter permease [Melioribacteraceae bacterium]|nr:ABC transporter permease [Melioribacteraceae bacterium]